MLKLISTILVHSFLVGVLAVVESTIGIPFLFFIFSLMFLQQHSVWLQMALVILWSVVAATLFSVPISVVAALLVIGLLFTEFGEVLNANRTGRIVLTTFVSAGVIMWLSGIVWSTGVIAYALISVIVGTVGVYQGVLFLARRQVRLSWKSSVMRENDGVS